MVALPPTIEVFQDLHFLCPEERRLSVRETLRSRSASPWRHAGDRERAFVEISPEESDYLVFERSADGELPACTLALFGKTGGYKVGNIIPKGPHDLTHSEYNDLLGEFAQTVLQPVVDDLELSITQTPRRQSITDWTSVDAASALRRFSVCANKSTGSHHPADRDRWFQFLVAAHECRSKMDTVLLERWLAEVEQWPQEIAHDLAREYGYSIDLLNFQADAA